MVYQKNYKKKTNYQKKYLKQKYKKPVGRWEIYGGAAKQLMSDVWKLKDAVNIEYKELAVGASGISMDWDGVIVPGISNITQGVAENQRIGTSAKLQNLTFRFKMNQTTANTNNLCRLIIFRDKQNNITTPAAMLSLIGTGLAPLSSKQETNKYKTKILYDQTFELNNQKPLRHGSPVLTLNFHQNYDQATGIIADGALKFLVLSDYDPAVSPASRPTFSYESQLSFTDN